MTKKTIFNFIKTPCGQAKYIELEANKTLLGKFRLLWFILIASIRDKGFWIITGDCFHWWFSRTTFSRLNALINTFGIDPYKQGVYMRKKKPYLSTWGGDKLEMSLNSSYWVHGVSLGWRESK